jgi:Ala-tRNA(Pro) deacylase
MPASIPSTAVRSCPCPEVQELLRRAYVPYAVYPGADGAVPACDWAKVVICFADGEPIQAVVPANQEVDLDRLQALARANTIRLAREEDFEWLFPDCELGAMPPLGRMCRQKIFVEESLTAEDRVVFNTGTHADTIVMRYEHFVAIAHPIVGRFGRRLQ